ncbi:HNH endonuclease signature motif containing protein [Streptomyces zingiberis]|uniref:HNH endonuclease signature motif containing protein n=1 Tax=Streptomyces zingiberis TaxID=2053010 RepID=UPI0019D106AF|nr:HNH endonuclease signature motif containing protein [Streptomyces zingiberis]
MARVIYTHAALTAAARDSGTLDEAVRRFGGTPSPRSRQALRGRMRRAGIDISHFTDLWVGHSEERLREAVRQSRSIAEVVRRLGISPVGGNQAHIGRRVGALGIDTSHFRTVRPERPGKAPGDRLVLGSPSGGRVPGRRLRAELLRRGVPEVCAQCGNGPVRNGRPLRLEVDHVNGEWWDNRPGNLRLLCPNCHAVTDSYRGRNRRHRLRGETSA